MTQPRKYFTEEVRMDTQTAFQVNGDINIYPCTWESYKAPLMDEKRVTYKGSITVRDDGSTQVKAYRLGAKGPRYEELFATEHCRVLRTPAGKIIEKWSFRPSLTADGIRILRNLESPRIDAFYISRKMETKW